MDKLLIMLSNENFADYYLIYYKIKISKYLFIFNILA